MSETLICPVCTDGVGAASSMCFTCHLPIKDVRANQKLTGRSSKSRVVASWLWMRLIGVVGYTATIVWCALKMPASLSFVVPAAVVGLFLHVVKGRPWLGLAAFVLIVVLVPLLFLPSILTGATGRLTDW